MPSFLRRLLCVGLLALSCAAVPPAAQARDDALLAAASAEQDAVLVTLEKLVGIETGTGDAQGLAAIADFLEAQLRALGAVVERHPAVAGVAGDNLIAHFTGRG